MGGMDEEHDCTRDEFEAWYNQLADLLATYDPHVARAMGGDLGGRTLAISLYGQQVKWLLDELTLLAQYKASTEAARRRAGDEEFMAGLRAQIDRIDRDELERRRADPEFMARLRARVEQDRVLLDLLADS